MHVAGMPISPAAMSSLPPDPATPPARPSQLPSGPPHAPQTFFTKLVRYLSSNVERLEPGLARHSDTRGPSTDCRRHFSIAFDRFCKYLFDALARTCWQRATPPSGGWLTKFL